MNEDSRTRKTEGTTQICLKRLPLILISTRSLLALIVLLGSIQVQELQDLAFRVPLERTTTTVILLHLVRLAVWGRFKLLLGKRPAIQIHLASTVCNINLLHLLHLQTANVRPFQFARQETTRVQWQPQHLTSCALNAPLAPQIPTAIH